MSEQAVRVRRSDLVAAFLQVSTATPHPRKSPASLSAAHGLLTVTHAGSSSSIRAEGAAEFQVPIDGLALQKADRLLPKEDILEIASDGQSVRIGSFRYQTRSFWAGDTALDIRDFHQRLAAAEEALSPYGVSRLALEELCLREPRFDPAQMQPQVERIAKAWAELAAFGVDTSDIEYLVTQGICKAWKP